MNVKLSDLSLVGWLVALATIALVVVLMIYSGQIYAHVLPAGRYPAFALAIPGLIIGAIFFGISAAILRRAGHPIVRKGREATAEKTSQ